EFYTGSFNRLFFSNDHDISRPTGEGYFANIKVYEQGTEAVTWVAASDLVTVGAPMALRLQHSSTNGADHVRSLLVQDEPARPDERNWAPADVAAVTPLLFKNPV